MWIRKRKGWEIPEHRATPEAVFLNRRAVLLAGAVGGASLLGAGLADGSRSAAAVEDDPSAGLYPFRRNEAYTIEGDPTAEKITSEYNNFYEYGDSKRIYRAAQALKTRPWTVAIGGMVEKPVEIGIDDLIKAMPLEERLYRHRCVEAWSMTIPWSGFALKALLDYARPLSGAKYIEMETFLDPKMAPGQRQPFYPWPYVEGLTMAEAANDLAFMVTGAYGKPLLKQYGAPLRLAVPWKYGFKSVKSIRKITFTDKQPVNFWQQLQPAEYGFWANVNPDVPHPRWSQATEEVLGLGFRQPTTIWNGYGEEVAALYAGMPRDRLFM